MPNLAKDKTSFGVYRVCDLFPARNLRGRKYAWYAWITARLGVFVSE
jgi:hypothetical protein